MFESLQQSLSDALRSLSGKATLSEANMREGLEQVRRALLEADVSIQVVDSFMARVSEESVGEKVLRSLNPSQHVVGIVFAALVDLMGPVDHSLHLTGDLTKLMLCGLQGSGKTTTCGKLGRYIRDRGRKPLLVAADLQRPAAVQQLHVLGEQLGIPVYSEPDATDPVAVCHNAVTKARDLGCHVVILDTAGRLHIDLELMDQLRRIDRRVEPDQVYLVVDGMTGQDAVTSAKAFNEALELDGLIMTKLDGDARGGAALSVKSITGVPIKFIGIGEHLDAIEEFHPDRMASRILGMGDVLTLVEKAQRVFDEEEKARTEERMRSGQLTLDDFRDLLKKVKTMGSIGKFMDLVPGFSQLRKMLGDVDEDSEVNRVFAIIDSMTPEERRNPSALIDQSRRRRIAAGSGTEPHQVTDLVKQFDVVSGMMKEMAHKGQAERLRMVQQMTQRGILNPGADLSPAKKGTGKRLTADEKRRMKKQREKELRRMRREHKKS
jgi:signal recognition particle subunit SRP54